MSMEAGTDIGLDVRIDLESAEDGGGVAGVPGVVDAHVADHPPACFTDQLDVVRVLQQGEPGVVSRAVSPSTTMRGLVIWWVVSTRPVNMARMVVTMVSRPDITGGLPPHRAAAGRKSSSAVAAKAEASSSSFFRSWPSPNR